MAVAVTGEEDIDPPTAYTSVLIAASPREYLLVGILLCVSHVSAGVTSNIENPVHGKDHKGVQWNLLLCHRTQW